jgi:hypothetical protein
MKTPCQPNKIAWFVPVQGKAVMDKFTFLRSLLLFLCGDYSCEEGPVVAAWDISI